MRSIESKLPNVGTTIFTVMSALAAEHGAINLSQGFPNFNPSERLQQLVFEHMRRGANQYAPMPGLWSLRERIAEKVARLYGATVSPDTEITITAGAYGPATRSSCSNPATIRTGPVWRRSAAQRSSIPCKRRIIAWIGRPWGA